MGGHPGANPTPGEREQHREGHADRGAFCDGSRPVATAASAQPCRLALTKSPTARNAPPIAANPVRHELVPASDTTTTGGPRAAPTAHDACSQPIYLTPRFNEMC